MKEDSLQVIDERAEVLSLAGDNKKEFVEVLTKSLKIDPLTTDKTLQNSLWQAMKTVKDIVLAANRLDAPQQVQGLNVNISVKGDDTKEVLVEALKNNQGDN